jgi:hypothetical protein
VFWLAALLLMAMKLFGDQRTEAFGPLPVWCRDEPLKRIIARLLIGLGKNSSNFC